MEMCLIHIKTSCYPEMKSIKEKVLGQLKEVACVLAAMKIYNTLKNRGFDAKHDYARANPNGMVIWKLLMFVALFVDQLFSITRLGINARGIRSLMKFAKDLLQQLVEVPWGAIVNSPILQNEKRQFRFCFGEASG